MNYKNLNCIDALLKLISNDLKLDFSYKLICKWNNQLVTLDLLIPYEWNDEFYLSEPKTISSAYDDSEIIYSELNSHYRILKDKFKFQKLLKHYKNQETNYLILYLLENKDFYDFDTYYFDYAYNVEALDKSWSIPIVKTDDDLEFISLHLVKYEQN
ncbi:hypothetical protein N7L96_06850 [Mammaliicoccus sciuri]|uniref:hypothetical protein n=1 Tax=Mammaliicoccus sciuri TaxID=1296 RepID=UPI002340E845|nr:hypothetical protein [Mammaliicoccus sciuri]MDC5694324.1 hypothetical protein [Mammaliicoccus sciuri]